MADFALLTPKHPLPSNWGITELGLEKIENIKKHIWDSYPVYTTKFNFLAQFGGELSEQQTQGMIEIKKPDQKTTF